MEQALLGTDGITSVTVSNTGDAHIEYDNTVLGPRDILQIVQVRHLLITYTIHSKFGFTLSMNAAVVSLMLFMYHYLIYELCIEIV